MDNLETKCVTCTSVSTERVRTLSRWLHVFRGTGRRVASGARMGGRTLAKSARAVFTRAQRAVRVLEPWGVLIAVMALFLAGMGLTVELHDRQSERVFRAWQVVSGDRGGRGSGLREAPEYLNLERGGLWCGDWVGWLVSRPGHSCLLPRKRREWLTGLRAPGTLAGIQLPNALLPLADFDGSSLDDADSSGVLLECASFDKATLNRVNLSDANLKSANLRGADIQFADLRGAHLWFADLYAVDLLSADMRGADVTAANLDVSRLSQAQLDQTCSSGGYPPRKLAEGLEWHGRSCEGGKDVDVTNATSQDVPPLDLNSFIEANRRCSERSWR